MEILTTKATTAQLEQFCDERGLDYSDIADTGLARRSKLMALVKRSGMSGDTLKLAGGADLGPEPAPRPAMTVRAAPVDEKLPDRVFRALCDALSIDFNSLKPGDRDAAMDRCIAHRNATRVDPRNPFPGRAHGDRVRLMIQEQDPEFVPGGDQPVFVSVNERATFASRGTWHEMEWETACALANAKTATHRQDDVTGHRRTGEVQSYPFSVG